MAYTDKQVINRLRYFLDLTGGGLFHPTRFSVRKWFVFDRMFKDFREFVIPDDQIDLAIEFLQNRGAFVVYKHKPSQQGGGGGVSIKDPRVVLEEITARYQDVMVCLAEKSFTEDYEPVFTKKFNLEEHKKRKQENKGRRVFDK